MTNIDLIKFQSKYNCDFENNYYIIRWLDDSRELHVSENELDIVIGLISNIDFDSFREFHKTHTLGMFDIIE
jgi:hypothetical protein